MKIPDLMESLKCMSQAEIVAVLNKYHGFERRMQAAFVCYLVEFERRQLYRELGYSSSFQWMTVGLGMSESTANRRVYAARLISRLPEFVESVLSGLATGQLNLTTVGLIASHVTPANGSEILRAVARKSRVEVERYLVSHIAGYRVMQSTRSSLRLVRLPEDLTPSDQNYPESQDVLPPHPAEATPEAVTGQCEGVKDKVVAAVNQKSGCAVGYKIPGGRSSLGSSIRLSVTLTGEGASGLLRLRELFPWKDPSQILSDAICLLRKARDFPAAKLPRETVRQVFARDGHQCTFVSDDGVRCPARGRLQIDHILPRAKGGDDRIENLRLLCAAHNRLMAERHFGRDFMRQRMSERQFGSSE